MSELRWHPLLGEWIITAAHRQDRTFLPPADYCPLCPTVPGGMPTEIRRPHYEIAVFENKFPALRLQPPAPAIAGSTLTLVAPAVGVCEVIAYTPEHHASLATLPVAQLEKLVRVWTHRYLELAARPEIAYVYIFENRGTEVGVTLHHPHGQLYAYGFIPAHVVTRRHNEASYFADHNINIHAATIRQEQQDGRRIVIENDAWIAFVPFYARWAYEVHVYPKQQREHLGQLDPAERHGLARMLQNVAQRYDRLWQRPMPYMLALFQAPTDNQAHPETRLSLEWYPVMRTATKRKYRSGGETGAGTWVNDTLPEETAWALREADVADDPQG